MKENWASFHEHLEQHELQEDRESRSGNEVFISQKQQMIPKVGNS